MEKHKKKITKHYSYIIHKDVDHYVDNRPTERAPKVEYTDTKETARKFFDEDFEVLQIDWNKHDRINVESTNIAIKREERVSVDD
ncbi:DUF2483 domain-containing protein [Staphylococcus warneri]|uniref:DUF2483 family protein n=1 Tax=Staphylococcus warneri TaxID=1292 RepID=UPI00066BE91F|nr:DUF2483 domain-containing protein [Staphylococcus warneri]MBY6181037.1 DUF2483 domain-containing protein [Staphylococcaceae bacterium DP2N0-1]